MTWFLIIAGLMVLAVLGLLLRPLLSGGENKRPALMPAIIVSVVLAGGAVGLYLSLGHPDAMQPGGKHGNQAGDLVSATQALARRMAQNPDDVDGWALLGRSYATLGDMERASQAFQRARQLAPRDPDVLVELAETTARANGFDLTGEPSKLLDQALAIDPKHQKGLWFAGMAAWQKQDYQTAVARWETLLGELEPGSEVAQSVKQQLARARAMANGEPPPAPPVASATNAPASAPASSSSASGAPTTITVQVSLAKSLASSVSPGDTLFVFARDPNGPPMPLAVERHSAGELPLTVTLDQSDAVMGGQGLANASSLQIVARISRDGSVTASSGGWQGSAEPTGGKDGSYQASVVIDKTL